MIDAGKCFVRSLARSNASIAEMLNDDAVLEECNAGGMQRWRIGWVKKH